ncbi:hypothetical protein ACVILI_001891 [Mesorhizobium sp. USDA 4775]|uniref:hypothetical protein n=1 Tax=Mesorhizobium jarvisii TaxID=1777867 RepID=UPI001F0A6302|nr:hypothetical protein [Mesorhizobium jarvisii]MCH4560989.1 hypothetical protein [Mesorhizobium jarvisii]
MSFYNTLEWSDDYPGVVAAIGPGHRVIVDRKGFGWNLQQRRASKGKWFNIASLLRSRANLARVALPLMHSGYVKEHGITQATIDAALAHLPERFSPEPTFNHLTVNTRPPPETPAGAPTSYKTAHDIFDPRP